MSGQKTQTIINRISLALVFLIITSILAIGYQILRNPDPKIHNSIGINEQINYQGRLLTNTGAVVPDGTYNVEFKIYQDGDGVLGGGDETIKWTETRTGGNKVLVKNGYFSVYLGAVTAFGSNVDWNQDTLWLSINIGGTGSPSWDGEMTPFTRFSSTPYALNSKALGGLTADNFVKLAQGVQADASTTNSSIFINKTGATSNILQFQKNAVDVFTVGNTGATLFRNSADSTTAFQVQKSNSDQVFSVDTATTANLLTNGNFESNTSGWALKGSSTISQTTSQRFLGNGSLQISTTATANDGAKYDYALASQTTYTLTFYAKSSSTTTSTPINTGRTEDGSTDSSCASGQTINGGGWTKVSCVFTTGNTSGTNHVYIKQTDATARTIYIDSVELQTSASLVGNTDFETDTTDWVGYGGASETQTGTQYYTGAGSMQINTSATSGSVEGASAFLSLTPSTTYRVSFWVQLDAGAAGAKTFWIYKRFDSTDSVSGVAYVSASLSPGVWTNITADITTSSVLNTNPFIAILTTDPGDFVTSEIFYVDNVGIAPIRYDTNDIGRIMLNGIIDSPVVIQGQTSTNALQVQSAAGSIALKVDTLNGRVGIGTNSPTSSLHVQGKTYIQDTTSNTDTLLIEGSTGLDALKVGANSRIVTVGDSTYTTNNGQLNVYGTSLIKNQLNTSIGFRVQNASSVNIFGVDTVNSRLFSGIADGASSTGFTLNTSNSYSTSGAKILSLQNATTEKFSVDKDGNVDIASGAVYKINGTNICTATGCAVDPTSGIKNQTSLQANANFYVQSAASGSVAGIVRGHASQTADIFQVKDGAGNNLMSVGSSGATTFRNQADSTSAFSIQNSSSTDLFKIDTTNSLISIAGGSNPSLRAWSSTTSLGVDKSEGGFVTANGYVYAIGSGGGGTPGTGVYYAKINADGTLGTWATTSNLNNAVWGNSAVVGNGYIYSIGGYDGGALDVVEYAKINADGTLGTWTVTSSLSTARYRHGAIAINGYVYAIGNPSASSVEYAKINADGTLGTWTATSSLLGSRYGQATVSANGYVYAIGGNNGSDLATVEFAPVNSDGTLGSWASNTSMGTAQNIVRAVVANGYVYTVGGCGGAGCPSTQVQYASIGSNGTLGTWSTTSSLGTGRYGNGAVVANGYIYAIGGGGATSVEYSSIERVQIGGALDLVGLSGGSLTYGQSGIGGELTAGNTKIVGGLEVQGQASLARSLSVGSDITVGGTMISGAADLTIRSGGVTGLNFIGEGGVYIDASALGQTYIGSQGSIQDVNIGNPNTSSATRLWAGTSGVLVQPGANTSTAFQIKDTGNVTLFGADTSNSRLVSGLADGASAVGFKFNTLNNFTTAGAKLLNLQNNSVEKFAVDKDGNVNIASGAVYQVNGTPGVSTTCSGGQFLQNQVTLGGLTTSGTCATPTDTGVTIVGAFSGSSQPNGASISGNTITFGPADASNPGMVTNGTQTFTGNKTFNGDVEIFGNSINLGNNIGDTILLQGEIGGASPLAFEGATNDNIRTIFAITDPTISDKTITFANATGTVLLHSMISSDALVDSAGVLTIQNGVVSNAKLANSSLTITAGSGLTTGGSVSLGSSVTLDIGAGNGITVNANDITLDLTVATDGLSATTSSSSGLEVLASGLTLLQGCANAEILKWTESSDLWGCSADGGYSLIEDEGSALANRATLNFVGGGISCADNGGSSRTDCSVAFLSSDGAGSTSSSSGLEEGSGGFGLLQGCSDGQTLKWNEAGSVWECGSDRATYSTVLSGDYTNATTTFSDVDDNATGNSDMAFAAGANEEWIFQMNLQNSFNTTADTKWQMNGPAGSTCDITLNDLESANIQYLTSCNASSGLFAVAATDTTGSFQITGYVTTGGTAGTFQLQHGQNTASGTNTIFAGSILKAYKISGADLAEYYYSSNGPIEPGTLVVADSSAGVAGVKKSTKPYERSIVGVVSTQPGIVLGNNKESVGGTPVPLALSGRVPVKVSTENGPIKPGDQLTSSSIPGVAMKATKAGTIVGQALSGYSDNSSTGLINMFIKTSYSNGDISSLSGYHGEDYANFGKVVLDRLINDSQSLIQATDFSGIATDRVVAGLEVISPKIITDEILLSSIKPIDGQQIKINGDVHVSGTLTADKIRANQIEGLEIFTNQISSLQAQQSQSNNSTGEQSRDIEQQNSSTPVQLGDITINSATVTLNMGVNGTITTNGLVINGPSQFHGDSVFYRLVTFVEKTIFRNDVNFEGRTTFNSDTAGFAIIKPGQSEIRVRFDQPYEQLPVVTASVRNGQFVQYAYKDLTEQGFTIVISQPATEQVEFSWTALSIRSPKTVSSP